MGDITLLLDRARRGEPGAREQFFSRIYGELKNLARAKLGAQPTLTNLDTAALVHEAYLKLMQREELPAGNRREFFGYTATVMRSVIVDYVRSRGAAKRGADATRITLATDIDAEDTRAVDVEALDEALRDLDRFDPRCREIVELRYFAGLSVEQIAELLGLSEATVKRDWQKARAFLFRALHG